MVVSIRYGIVFLEEPATVFTYIAIVVFFVSMMMVNYSKTKKSEGVSFSVKWLIYVIFTAISNGFISVISREQQLRFDCAYDNEFMILSFGGAFLFLLVFSLFKESKNMLYILKHGTFHGMIAGLLNGGTNLSSLILYLYIPISVLTPLKTGLGFIISFFISVFLYKEKFSKIQIFGIILAIISLVMFKL